jgi:hypothetical protein
MRYPFTIAEMRNVHTRGNSHMFRIYTIVSLLLVFPSRALQQEQDESKVLARIGPASITVQEFLERLDLIPWPGKDNPATRDSAKFKALASLVAEKLLAMQAVDQGISTMETTTKELKGLERLFARDEMYRSEIQSVVSVRPEEINEGIRRFAFVLTLNSYIMRSEQEARLLAEMLNRSNDKRPEPIPRSGVVSHDTIKIRFGDLSESVERAAYAIDSVGHAQVFHSPADGWFVLQLLDRETNDAYMKASSDTRRSTVEQLIRQRKELQRAREFLRPVFTENIKLDSTLFHMLAESLRVILVADSAGRREEGTFGISSDVIGTLKERLKPMLTRSIASMGKSALSCEELIDELLYFPVRFASLRRNAFLKTLNEQIRSLVEAGLISQEALRRGMERRPGVQRDLRVWRESVQADRMLRHLVDSLGGELTSGRASDPSLDSVLKASGMMNTYLASLAGKYGVELHLDQLRQVRINPSNMVTKRFIGFGGEMMGVPMLLRLWEWVEAWMKTATISP